MDVIVSFFATILNFFKLPISVYGFTFSFWDVMLFGILASVLVSIVRGIFNG